MSAVARFDLKMNVEEKDVVSRAAALVGTTMAAFVRAAAKEKARELLIVSPASRCQLRIFRHLQRLLMKHSHLMPLCKTP